MLTSDRPSVYRARGRAELSLRQFWLALLLPLLLILSGCKDQEDRAYTPTFSNPSETAIEYVFGVHPLHNPQQLNRVYGPLVDYLNRHLGTAALRLEASLDYADFERKLYSGRFHFSLPNPHQTLEAFDHGYRVFGKMADDHNFRGIILVRRDAGIDDVSQLRGKVISYPAPTALAAAIMPQEFLQGRGLNVRSETTSIYVGSQESSIMNVVLGRSAAGATWPPPWEVFAQQRPDLASQVEVKWETPPLVNNGLVAHQTVPDDVTARIGELLFSLHESEEGRTILKRMALSKFEPAENATYTPVRDFLDRFAKTVRPLD